MSWLDWACAGPMQRGPKPAIRALISNHNSTGLSPYIRVLDNALSRFRLSIGAVAWHKFSTGGVPGESRRYHAMTEHHACPPAGTSLAMVRPAEWWLLLPPAVVSLMGRSYVVTGPADGKVNECLQLHASPSSPTQWRVILHDICS